MNGIPANISVAGARLPQSYEAAKVALANCASLDECKDWSDRAEALASYAKQADDDSLRIMADRIQARAVRRCGELLKQVDARQGQNLPGAKNEGAHTFSPTQRDVARDAGMSDHQRVQAVRVANVPEPTFEAAVESSAPPTVTKLADMGRKPRQPAPPPPTWTPPAGFQEATKLLGRVRDFARFCAQHDPALVAGGVMPNEASDLRRQVSTIDGWLDRFVVTLKD